MFPAEPLLALFLQADSFSGSKFGSALKSNPKVGAPRDKPRRGCSYRHANETKKLAFWETTNKRRQVLRRANDGGAVGVVGFYGSKKKKPKHFTETGDGTLGSPAAERTWSFSCRQRSVAAGGSCSSVSLPKLSLFSRERLSQPEFFMKEKD